MEKLLASQLLQASLALDKSLGELDQLIGAMPDDEERRVFAKALGDVIGHVNDALIRPIVRQHPSLDPDG